MFESYEFLFGAGTVGVVFGGYWLWNHLRRMQDRISERIERETEWTERELWKLRDELAKHETSLKKLEESNNSNFLPDVQSALNSLEQEIENQFQEVQLNTDTLRRDIQDQFREVQSNIDTVMNEMNDANAALRQEFDARVTGEVRNIQRMLHRKLEESDVQA